MAAEPLTGRNVDREVAGGVGTLTTSTREGEDRNMKAQFQGELYLGGWGDQECSRKKKRPLRGETAAGMTIKDLGEVLRTSEAHGAKVRDRNSGALEQDSARTLTKAESSWGGGPCPIEVPFENITLAPIRATKEIKKRTRMRNSTWLLREANNYWEDCASRNILSDGNLKPVRTLLARRRRRKKRRDEAGRQTAREAKDIHRNRGYIVLFTKRQGEGRGLICW